MIEWRPAVLVLSYLTMALCSQFIAFFVNFICLHRNHLCISLHTHVVLIELIIPSSLFCYRILEYTNTQRQCEIHVCPHRWNLTSGILENEDKCTVIERWWTEIILFLTGIVFSFNYQIDWFLYLNRQRTLRLRWWKDQSSALETAL